VREEEHQEEEDGAGWRRWRSHWRIWRWGRREAMRMINKQEWGGSGSELQDGKRQFLENWKFFPSLVLSLVSLSLLSNFFLY
jgi:hypothetical protein